MNTKVVYSALAIALAVLSPAFCGEAPQPGDGQPLKVLMVGNSFSLSNLREMPNIAKSMGLRLDLGSLYIGGCTLERHWRNVEAAESSATNRPYVFDLYVDGRKVISEKANIQETLVRDKWDVVTIQQASHASWNPDTYHPWGDNLVAKIRELAPQAKIFVQETWSYPPWDGRLAKFGFGPEEMYRRLHVAYGAFAEKHGLEVIPVGTAAEIVPSRNSLFKKPDFHFNGEGMYLQGLMFTARLFGVDARKCEYKPKSMAAERAEKIKEAVAATLAGAEPPDPPPTAEDRLRAVKLDDGGEITVVERRGDALRVAFSLAPTPKSFIRCELSLPAQAKWDGRLWGFGNGGWAGAVSFHSNATSACVHSDLGTSKSPYDETPTDREILRDYAWRATHLMTVAAKRLVEAYYGSKPDKCYFSGASCGGLQGVQEAALFPEDYDGIVSEVPGITERSRGSNAWRHKRLKEKYGKWFTKDEIAAVREAELAWFAKTDPEFARGRFIVDPYPTKEKLDGCWGEIVARNPALADREQLWRELFDPLTVNGEPYAAGRLIGVEFAGAWSFLLPKYLGLANLSEATEADLAAYASEAEVFPPADLSAFKARGGKIIMYGGLEDSSCPELEIREYYRQVAERCGGEVEASKFFAYYSVPGRTHGAKGEPSGQDQIGSPIGLDGKIVDWVEKGVHPVAVSFKWNNEPKELVVAPHPDCTVTCKDGAGMTNALTFAPRWDGNDIVAGSKRLSVRDDSKLVLTEGGETLFSMQYMCRAVSKATGKTLWPSPAYRFAEGGGKMSRDGDALVHESPYTLEGFTWEDAFRQRVELLPDGLVAIDVTWTDPDNDNFTFRPKGASWSVSYELSKGARFSVNGEVRDMPQAPRNGGDTWRAGPDGTIEYVLFEGDAARRFRIFTRPGEAGDTAYLFSLNWGNEFRITEKIDGRRRGYRLYLDLRQGVEARPDEDMHRKAEAQKAEASRPETVKYGVRKYEKPMEIGNYDVEIDLADGPSTNFVKFMGRRIAIDRTELKAGEKRTVSFTARVPGPYTLNRGGGTRRLSIELFTDPPQAGEKEFAPRVTPNPSARTIYICGDSTVEDHANEPLGSWGLVLPAFVRQGWTTANFAQSGRSMKTFEEEGRLERIFEHLAKDDWVMIQFGHNDQKIKGEEAENGYTRRLGEWIDRIREKGAHPVLVTPVERRGFSSGKQWGKSLAKYAEAVKAVAAAKDVPYIDLNDASYRMMGVLGAEGSKRLQRPVGDGQVDNTHHNMYGAYEMARIIAAGLAKIPVVGDAIREPYREFDPEKPDAESAVAIPPSGTFRNVKPAGD